MSTHRLKVGLLGCGTVGRGLVELMAKNDSLIRQRTGLHLGITKILVRDMAKERPGVSRDLLTTDPDKVLNNGCDLVVELVGGLEPAGSFIRHSLARRKHVVTANKALLAQDGFQLMKTAENHKVRLGFEASVCGGVPIVRALRDGLVGNRIQSLRGILNGTCNYILTRMTEDQIDFDAALRDAQSKGFAEADPTLDVDGHDAAQKLKILAELAFNTQVPVESVECEGIRGVKADDIQATLDLGYVIKHVATAELEEAGLRLRAAPTLLPEKHQLAGVHHENNAVLIRGDAVGEMLFCGKGAGSLPSASAVLSDIVDIAYNHRGFRSNPEERVTSASCDYKSKHYLRFCVHDPSAIGPITTVLERNQIVVSRAAAVWAKNESSRHQVRVLTHPAAGQAVAASLCDIAELGLETAKALALRVAE